MLNDSNRWAHTWTRLPRGSNWVIAEEDVPGYLSAGVWFGNTYRLTNTYRGEGHNLQTDTDKNIDSDKTVTSDTDNKLPSDTDYKPINSDDDISKHDKTSTDSSYDPKNYNVTPDSQNERLPQTGVLWWPVPMMIALGLLFIIIGLLIKRKGIKNEK